MMIDERALWPSRDPHTLTMYVIYDHPRDYPDHYIVRPRDITNGVEKPRQVFAGFKVLDQARAWCARLGLACMQRNPDDDPCIVEVWF